MCPAILYTAVMHSAACSLASKTLTSLDLLVYSASTHFLEGPCPPPPNWWEKGGGLPSLTSMVPTPMISLLLTSVCALGSSFVKVNVYLNSK